MIRTAARSDAQAIAEVRVRSWQKAYKGIVPQEYLNNLSIERSKKHWLERFGSGNIEEMVSEVNGKITGWLAFGPSRDEDNCQDYEIYAVYVLSQFWKQGFGRLLMAEAEKLILQKGIRNICLWVLKQNKDSQKFYRKLEYREDGKTKILEIGGKPLSVVRLCKGI